MSFRRGDACYILGDNDKAVKAKIVNKQGKVYIVQLFGVCGAIKLPEEKLFSTPQEAEASRKTISASVSPQLSGISRASGIPEIPGVSKRDSGY
ncbi:hypothetical protein [Luxibacter massiliensis]|uniref:hypothetical protein n=1 Tax=Luxibacter massiliensis TaxID=2219695 RepID=UPI000F060D32|nr:hypothetical protein [Luxibacter massiliensis]